VAGRPLGSATLVEVLVWPPEGRPQSDRAPKIGPTDPVEVLDAEAGAEAWKADPDAAVLMIENGGSAPESSRRAVEDRHFAALEAPTPKP
jgi:hypothetical protein